MKKSGLLIIFGAILFLASCADKPTRPGTLLSEGQKAAADAAATAAANAGIQGAPAGVGSLPHYYCPNSCEGSGGDAQGSCPTCGTAYVHNAAFHNQAPTPPPVAGTSTSTTTGGIQTITTPPMGNNGVTSTPLVPQQVTKAPEPPQNADGVWHYTCSAGCSGGAGGAGSCSQCGNALSHNSAYHN